MKDISNGPHIETNSVLHALKDFCEFIQAPKKNGNISLKRPGDRGLWQQ